MGFRGFTGTFALAAIAAIGYVVYAPRIASEWSPAAGALAQRWHDRLGLGKPAPAPAQSADAAPVLVSVTPARRADYIVRLEGLGQVQAYNTVTVRTRVDGQIDKIAFREGQIVKSGDLLAQIDPRAFQATLEAAEAKRTQDEANLANARLDQQRYATLAKQSFATQQQLDTQNALVNQLIAQIAADKAAIDAAKVQLDYTRIVAPISGRVGFRLVDEGNMVAASQQTGIVNIAQIEPIAVVFTAPEEEVGRVNNLLAAGAPKVVVRNSANVELASGALVLSDNQIDMATGMIKLKAEFANQDQALWPGLAVSTSLIVGVDKGALIVPTPAVQHSQDGLYVYVVDERNQAAIRKVTIAHQDVDTTEIAKGLAEGDRVVTTGQFLLHPGSPVSLAVATNGS